MTQEFNFSAIWNQVLQSLADEIDASSFDIWFSMVKFETVRNDRVYISVPNSLTKEWIESRYLGNLQNKLRSLTNQEIELILNTESQIEKEGMFPAFNHKYTFDTFVVGNSNRFVAVSFRVGQVCHIARFNARIIPRRHFHRPELEINKLLCYPVEKPPKAALREGIIFYGYDIIISALHYRCCLVIFWNYRHAGYAHVFRRHRAGGKGRNCYRR